MLERLLDLWFLRPLPGMSPSEAKVFRVQCAVPAIAGLMHAVHIVIFGVVGYGWLSVASVASVMIFVVAIGLIRRRFIRTGLWISYLEVAAHMTWLTVSLGAGAGYAMYALPLAVVPFVALTQAHRITRVLFIVGGVLGWPALHLWDRYYQPLLRVDPALTEGLFFMNLAGVLVALIAITGYFSLTVHQAEAETVRERERSDRLLRNILPDAVAERLKDGEEKIADAFDGVSVLFADIVGFTALSARLDSEALIDLLNEIFSAFDRLADELGLEKIKTIGDAYMVVGGLPEPSPGHAEAIARMALGMRRVVHALKPGGEGQLDVRIGVHSGPVVAGVIGRRKFAYDLWGDTVNTASRMESHGEPGRIQVSEQTRRLLGPSLRVIARGTIAVKGKGEMRTWWLEGDDGAS